MSTADDLARLVEEVSGNVVPEREIARLERQAGRLAAQGGFMDLDAYVRHLARHRSGGDWRKLLEFVTVNESYLFRASRQFAVLTEVVLPGLLGARREQRSLRLWSAGCARGEEAVTLAITCAESPQLVGWRWEVLATDVDEAALADAESGRYGARAVARVPPPLLERYFTRQGSTWTVHEDLLAHIRYRHLNLVHEPFAVSGEHFDVIFLRNVLIYFRESSQRRVAAAVAKVLAKDGALFLGPSESLWKLSHELAPVDLGGCFVYRHRGVVQPPESRLAAAPSKPPSPRPAVAPATVQAISAPEPRAPAQPPAPGPAPSPNPSALVQALADGRIEAAIALSGDLLARSPETPDLHALRGLLEDARGHVEEAVRSYRAALYLDPGLFQARVLLARALARSGWPGRARHEFGEALITLARNEGRELADGELLALPTAAQAAQLARDALDQLAGEDG